MSSSSAKVPVLESKPSSAGADVVIVPVVGDSKKPKTISDHSSLLKKLDRVEWSSGSMEWIRFAQGGKSSGDLLLAGLGEEKKIDGEVARKLGGGVCVASRAKKAENLLIDVDQWTKVIGKEDRAVTAALGVAEGIAIRSYRFDHHQTDKKKKVTDIKKITLVSKKGGVQKKIKAECTRIMAAVEAMNITRNWSNEPSNVGTPTYFAKEAQKFAKQYGMKCKVLGRAEAKREKMGLFLGVANGSREEPKMVILDYNPSGSKKKTVALVGKGVTFDTGGTSLKPSARMEDMKHDMTGAATMMGAIALAAKWKVKHRVVAILAFAENKPGGPATNPGDIHTGRSGKTVEIINTDAEGRLVLADAMDYIQDNYKPDVMVNAATLTGAVGIALGPYCCAILGNDDKIVEGLQEAGSDVGERLWRLPLYPEYLKDMKSTYADLRNIGNSNLAGTCKAAAFLEAFVKNKTRWAHLDIAYTATDQGYLPYFPKKGASGMHVRGLARFIENF